MGANEARNSAEDGSRNPGYDNGEFQPLESRDQDNSALDKDNVSKQTLPVEDDKKETNGSIQANKVSRGKEKDKNSNWEERKSSESDGMTEKEEKKGSSIPPQADPGSTPNSPGSGTLQGENKTEKNGGKKRLTLQERLELAAKGKAKKGKVSGTNAKKDSSEDPHDFSLTKDEHDTASVSSDKVHDSEKDELRGKIKALSGELANVKVENKELNKRLQTSQKPSTSFSDKEKMDFLKKIEEKEETIKQLLQEGEALSVKELKLNDTIKKLKATIADLENMHSESSKREESNSSVVQEIEKLMKNFKVKSVSQIPERFEELKTETEEAKQNLSQELEMQWKSKYLEHQKLYNDELEKRKSLAKEFNELRIQYDLSKEQNALEMKTKDNVIKDLKRTMLETKGQNADEIARLENKIEFLRVQNESSHNGPRGETTDESSKSVDYEEYVKLSNNHYNLQQQYLSSQENWKLIESNLTNKVDSLSSTIDLLKRQNTKLSSDLSRLQAELQDKEDDIEACERKEKTLIEEKSQLKLSLSMKEEELVDLKEKFDKFKEISNTNSENLNRKIEKLQEEIASQLTENSGESFEEMKAPVTGLSLSLEQPRAPFKTSPPNAISESSAQYGSWADIKLGESSTTPYVNKEGSSFFMNHSNNVSRMSFNDNNLDSSSEDDYLAGGRNNSSIHTISGVIPNSSNHNKIQLINKMTSNIRRLEVELSTVKEENSQLSNEKENLEKEILSKWKLADQADDMNSQINELSSQLEQKKEKERQLLELIGEQSERIEELKADVSDLKDLCKLQVQQMIELQESK